MTHITHARVPRIRPARAVRELDRRASRDALVMRIIEWGSTIVLAFIVGWSAIDLFVWLS